MGIVIGMDEAGYGPNLGPLVISATVWNVPGDPREFDFWAELSEVITSERPGVDDQRLHVADSKQVYSPALGLGSLERSVRSLLNLVSAPDDSFLRLTHWLTGPAVLNDRTDVEELSVEPWFAEADLRLPCVDTSGTAAGKTRAGESRGDSPVSAAAATPANDLAVERLRAACQRTGLQFQAAVSDIVLTRRFNQLTRQYGSKGGVLSRLTMRLLRRVWNPDTDDRVLIIGDKHGGRNRYDELIDEVIEGQMILRQRESREKSSYRVGQSELHFQTGAEAHFPVAVASMICKYVRELAMEQFNSFWRRHLPDLKPTKGYPVDARRFHRDIASVQQRLGIPDDVVWRNR